MKKFLIALLLCLFTLPLWAENTILIVGDSLSASYGIDIKQGWVGLLETRLKAEQYSYRVVNASISGDTSSNGLARLPPLLKKEAPQITIIELGGNDGLRGLQLDVIKRNLQEMASLARRYGSQVLLLGIRLPPNYGPEYINAFQQIYIDVARAEQARLVPNFLQNVDENKILMQSDGIHPTAAAQNKMLENVWPVLKPMLQK